MATESVERRLAAIVAVDVAGYSRLMEKDDCAIGQIGETEDAKRALEKAIAIARQV